MQRTTHTLNSYRKILQQSTIRVSQTEDLDTVALFRGGTAAFGRFRVPHTAFDVDAEFDDGQQITRRDDRHTVVDGRH